MTATDTAHALATRLARLALLDTCGVSDALDRLGLQGAVLGLQPMWPCPRIAGQVITVRLRKAELCCSRSDAIGSFLGQFRDRETALR